MSKCFHPIGWMGRFGRRSLTYPAVLEKIFVCVNETVPEET